MWTNSLILFKNIALRLSDSTKSSNILTDKCTGAGSSYSSNLTYWTRCCSLTIRNRTMRANTSFVLVPGKLIIRDPMRVYVFILILPFNETVSSVRQVLWLVSLMMSQNAVTVKYLISYLFIVKFLSLFMNILWSQIRILSSSRTLIIGIKICMMLQIRILLNLPWAWNCTTCLVVSNHSLSVIVFDQIGWSISEWIKRRFLYFIISASFCQIVTDSMLRSITIMIPSFKFVFVTCRIVF